MRNEKNFAFGPVSGDDMATWCDVLRDSNAIHLSKAAAQDAGFGANRVNPGPANLAYVISAYLQHHSASQIGRIKAIFNANIVEEDQLHITLHEENDGVKGALYRENTPYAALEVTIGEVRNV